jgi:hypothetical protein
MDSNRHGLTQYRSEIRNLIAEVRSCIKSQPDSGDREFDLQSRAFRERCDQAGHLTRKLETAVPDEAENQWSLRDGDAHRIEESLKLSLDYFRDHR